MKKTKIYLIFLLCLVMTPFLVEAKTNLVSDNLLIMTFDSSDLEIGSTKTEEIHCESIFKDKDGNYNALYETLQDVFSFIKFLAPILVVVLSSIDYIKAITSHDAEGLKKANEKFIKRLIIGIILFLLPFILDFIFEIFGIYDLETCGIGK